jgi:predicted aldo/keto reductase-like oxidoreductase
MALKKRRLGKTGLYVTEVGFGGIPIQRISEEEAISVVKRCYELGINYYDTARGYTTSEERIGKALKGVRDNVYIATKSHAKTGKELRENLATSLKNLRTDYLDLYQLHNVGLETYKTLQAPGGALEELLKIKEEGIARHIGATSHSPTFLTSIVNEGTPFETIMVGYNYIALEPSRELLPLCKKMGIGTVIMKPFGGGAFTNARTALKFVLANENADCTIPGMQNVTEVEENVAVCGEDLTLEKDELDSIELDRVALGNEFCAACDYCQPCPAGIPISFVLRTEMSSLRRMGWTNSIVKQTRETAPKVDACLDCGACETRCPYQLPIRKLLPEKMDALLKRLEERSIP